MLKTSDFDYTLPEELIAQTPSAERGASRLLVVGRTGGSADGRMTDGMFADILHLIPAGDLVVLNTTKVRHARLLGTRPSGAPAEVLLLTPRADGSWEAMG